MDFIDNIDCLTFDFDDDNACSDLIVGLLATGEDCETQDQCAGASYCNHDGSQPGQCGECTLKLDDGRPCNHDEMCVSGYCKWPAAGGNNGTCTKRAQLGESCQVQDDCTGRLECVGDAANRECAEPPQWKSGDPCDPQAESPCGPFGGDPVLLKHRCLSRVR